MLKASVLALLVLGGAEAPPLHAAEAPAPRAAAAAASPLVEAVKSGNRDAALALVAQRVDVNAPEPDGTTALHWAVQRNDLELVSRLIRAGAKVNAKNDYGATPMSEAAIVASAPLLGALLEAGADVESPNADGQTALMVVARTSEVDAARLLIQRGANVNAVEKWRGQTALMWAVAQRQPAMVRELVARGAQVNARSTVNDWQRQVTGGAARDLPSGRRVDAAPVCGARGLRGMREHPGREGRRSESCRSRRAQPAPHGDHQHAVRHGRVSDQGRRQSEPVGSLGARAALRRRGREHAPARRPSRSAFAGSETPAPTSLRMLLDAGANPNARLRLPPPFRNVGNDRGLDGMLTTGSTPLLRAAKALDAPVIRLLLAKGADLTFTNSRGMTPTMAAAGLGSTDADTRGFYLSEDTQQRSIESLTLLLDAGGDINAKDSRGLTALHEAARWGWNDVVTFLVSRGADLNAKDAKGNTPVDSALGKAGGNSRGGARIDVHEDTAALLRKLAANPKQ